MPIRCCVRIGRTEITLFVAPLMHQKVLCGIEYIAMDVIQDCHRVRCLRLDRGNILDPAFQRFTMTLGIALGARPRGAQLNVTFMFDANL